MIAATPSFTARDAARLYLARGYAVVPLAARSKRPAVAGWTNLRLGEDDLGAHFVEGSNIGLILGEASGGLVDVDLDCEEAVELAEKFLPITVVTGREGRPRSHWWFRCPGITSQRFHDPVPNECMLEIRSTGHQTVVGPSVHPEGGRYDVLEGDPFEIDPATLLQAVQSLANAVLHARGRESHPDERSPSSPRLTTLELSSRVLDDSPENLRRASAYLAKMPSAISGQGGHNSTYAAATAMVHGFCLSPDAALDLLKAEYNPRCEPPWSDKELWHKVEDAWARGHDSPYGWLRNAPLERTHAAPVRNGVVEAVPTQSHEPESDDDRPPPPRDPGEFPDYLLDVPGFVGEVVAHDLATAVRPQPVLALAGAIALQAALAGRKVRDERDNRTNLYLIGVAPSGSGKDHARKVAKNVLHDAAFDELVGNEDLASDAGLIAALALQPSLLLLFDEIGRFLRTIGDPKKGPHLFNVLSVLMKLYSSADTTFKGKAYANAKQNKVIVQPCAVVYGTTVPEHFFESLTPETLSDGFVARLLVFEGDPNAPRQRMNAAPVPEGIVRIARVWGQWRVQDPPTPRVVPATPGANAVFDRFSASVEVELHRENAARSLWARAEEKACRLALVYACSKDHANPIVDQDAAAWACDLVGHLTLRTISECVRWIAQGQFDAKQKKVLRAVHAAGGQVTRSRFTRLTQWMSPQERREVADNLVETGQLVVREERTSTKPRTVYAIPQE